MRLLEQFQKEVNKSQWWRKNEKILVAVSGGVDSMALFHLIRHLPEIDRPQMCVAHVNHQLRVVSDQEELFVKNECSKYKIPFFSVKWEEGRTVKKNVEQAARHFRYAFFERVMEEEKIGILITAHHKNDQVETILMRLINGNRLKTLVGMKEERLTSFGKIIRPLLGTPKSTIYLFMEEKQYGYCEDDTNKENDYFRNRLRNELLPQLRKENSQIDEHLIQFQEELNKGLTLIEQVINPLYHQCIKLFNDRCEIDVALWQTYSPEIQHFIMDKIIQSLQETFHLPISRKTQLQLEEMLNGDQPNKVLSLKKEWYFRKEYERAIISKKENKRTGTNQFHLVFNEGVYLSEREWIVYGNQDSFVLPKEVSTWQKKEMPIKLKRNETLTIRKKKPGDRLIINHSGQTKKVSRYFIDEKIPLIERQRSWIVEGEDQTIKWLLPFRGSYLSIQSETDKLDNKLVYYYLKNESSWRKN